MNEKQVKRVRRLLKKAMREPDEAEREAAQAEFTRLPERVQRRAIRVVTRNMPPMVTEPVAPVEEPAA